jgi:hypothetical protein
VVAIGQQFEHDDAFHRVFSLPLLHVELNGIPTGGPRRPADWQTNGQPGCESTWWPFNPLHPPNSADLTEGAYVLMAGSLVTDSPHVATDYFGTWWAGFFGSGDEAERMRAAFIVWGGYDDHDPNHDARWTEMHPPDLIQTIPRDPADRIETLRGVALVAANGLVSGETQTLDVGIRPPSPRPRKSKAAVIEIVGPETNFSTIIEGNATRSGARLTILDDQVRVHVTVQGQAGWGAPGKFKAIYRVFWEPDPTQPDNMAARIEPHPVPTDVPVQVVVRAENVWTHEPVAGQVQIDGQNVGATNTPFTFIFRMKRVRVFDSETRTWHYESVPPKGRVTAPGYFAVDLDLGLAPGEDGL